MALRLCCFRVVGVHMATPGLVSQPPGITRTSITQLLSKRPLSTGRLARFWDEEIDLCLQLVNSLAVTAKKYPRAGWIRGNENPEALLRRIVELEDTNKALQDQLAVLHATPIVEVIKQKLADQILNVTYQVEEAHPAHDRATEADETKRVEKTDHIPMQKVAEFMLPRLKKETSSKDFAALAINAVNMLIADKVVVLSQDNVDTIEKTFDELGLINIMTRQFGENVHTSIAVTYLGLEIAKEENLKLKRLAKLEQKGEIQGNYQPPTVGKVIGQILDAFVFGVLDLCRWLIRQIAKRLA